MAWIKRNLYFLVGGVVAAALLGLAGFYFYSKWALNSENQTKLDGAYEELKRISSLTPNPGNDKVNNTEIARQQQAKLRAIIDKERAHFVPITPIPNPAGKVVAKEEFASALRRTVDELTRAADVASVTLPPKYNFSFQAQRDITTFVAGSLEPLAVQLGEVKTICNVLFRAKVNSLDNLRRLRVSDDDSRGAQSDYLDSTILAVTNELAVLMPYEVTFRCFSMELGGVLAGFANAPHGFVVKSINVESGSGGAAAVTDPVVPYSPEGFRSPEGYRNPYGGYPAPAPVAAATVTKGGLPVLLEEKPLKVTLILNLVKLLPKQ